MSPLSFLIAVIAILGAVIPVVRSAEFQVTVGGIGVIQYNPEFVNANPGDTVVFTFKQKNHTVTQSSLDSPCTQLQDGFDSGFVPVPDTQTDNFTVAQFTVKDTNPVWVYCRQVNHCQQGMVFAINPGNNFDTFRSNAVGNSTATSTAAATGTATASVVTVTTTVTVDGTAQTSTYTTAGASSTSATSTSSAAAHVVTVGMNGVLAFSPNNITAQVGDSVTFQFTSKNHTATQSSFADPCTPLEQTSVSGQVGFDSGFMPVAANLTTFPSFTVTVNDTAPIWVYCKQTNPTSHCQQGMVFAVNAPTVGTNTMAAFVQNALDGSSSGAAATTAPPAPSTPAVSVSTGTVSAVPSGPAKNGAHNTASRGAGVLVAIAAAVAGVLL